MLCLPLLLVLDADQVPKSSLTQLVGPSTRCSDVRQKLLDPRDFTRTYFIKAKRSTYLQWKAPKKLNDQMSNDTSFRTGVSQQHIESAPDLQLAPPLRTRCWGLPSSLAQLLNRNSSLNCNLPWINFINYEQMIRKMHKLRKNKALANGIMSPRL